jgi:hypothetical protein
MPMRSRLRSSRNCTSGQNRALETGTGYAVVRFQRAMIRFVIWATYSSLSPGGVSLVLAALLSAGLFRLVEADEHLRVAWEHRRHALKG